jgi:hypothetical protein
MIMILLQASFFIQHPASGISRRAFCLLWTLTGLGTPCLRVPDFQEFLIFKNSCFSRIPVFQEFLSDNASCFLRWGAHHFIGG